jgi:hypothetical protein
MEVTILDTGLERKLGKGRINKRSTVRKQLPSLATTNGSSHSKLCSLQ